MKELSQASARDIERGPELPVTARWAGRRLVDAVTEVFHEALARGDSRMAEDLLAVMERAWELADAIICANDETAAMLIRCWILPAGSCRP